MADIEKKHSFFLFLVPAFGSLAIYIAVAYFLEREDSFLLMTGYILLFLAYFSFVFNTTTKFNVFWLIIFSIIFRMSFILATPNLSDDFYRFIWDGRLIINEIHPFSHVPQYFMTIKENLVGINQELYAKLNSPNYYTIYPPVCQAIFTASAFLFPENIDGSVLIMRLVIILAELGSLFIMVQALQDLDLPIKKIIFYALNPLVVLELSGNLHFEAVMIFFLITSLYLFQKEKLVLSAILFSLAVCTKLIPLIFLPLFLKRLGKKKALAYYAIVGSLFYLMYIPFISIEFIKGFSSSFLYYFSRFEFNASIYYVIREAGFLLFNTNIIVAAGAILALSIFVLIIYYAKKEDVQQKTIYESCMWVLMIYLLLSTTLHPWYIIPLLSLSIFTKYRFPIVWSFLIFFTYLNYTAEGYHENLWIVFFEYFFMLIFLMFELKYYPQFQEFKQSIRKKFHQPA